MPNALKRYNLQQEKKRKIKLFKRLGLAPVPKKIIGKIRRLPRDENVKFLVVDLFCGAGGTSSGFEKLVDGQGRKIAKVIACINHDPLAINAHYLNFPEVSHFTEDIRRMKMRLLNELVEHYRGIYPNAKVILWASLECTNFSNAKGGLPRDADSRTLAWHLFRYEKCLCPDYIQIENVREFRAWGELDKNGKPVSRTNGIAFQKWISRLCKYGNYQVDWKLLNSADYGAYTARTRLFMIFAKHGLPISFPKPTHARNPKKAGWFDGLKKWKAVREVLDLDTEGDTIFEPRPSNGKYLVDKTLARVYAGLLKFAKRDNLYLIKNYGGNPTDKAISQNGPAHTITCVDHHAAVRLHFMDEYYGNGRPNSVELPCKTITTKDRHSLYSISFMNQAYGRFSNKHLDQPAGVIVTQDKHELVNVQFLFNPQFKNKGASIDKPCFTLIAQMGKKPPGIVTAQANGRWRFCLETTDTPMMRKIKLFCIEHGITDIRMRGLLIPELLRIQGFDETYNFGPASETAIKKFIGNSVVPNIVTAINLNLFHKIIEWEAAEAVAA